MILSNFLHKFSQTRGLGGGEQFLAYLDILLYSWDRCWPILIWIFSCKLVSKKVSHQQNFARLDRRLEILLLTICFRLELKLIANIVKHFFQHWYCLGSWFQWLCLALSLIIKVTSQEWQLNIGTPKACCCGGRPFCPPFSNIVLLI